jgi:propanediol dehydratase large subunit
MRHHAQALRIMVEAANRPHRLVQRVLAGMAERRVAEVVGQRNGLHQVLVERKRARKRPCDLRHLQAMRQPRAVMVALVINKNLRLMDEPIERGRAHDAVAVALIDRA